MTVCPFFKKYYRVAAMYFEDVALRAAIALLLGLKIQKLAHKKAEPATVLS